MRAARLPTLLLTLAVGLVPSATAQVHPANPDAPDWTDPAPHASGFATVNGVRLHYLDWGGDGPPLVLLHGLWDDPHVFDDLARHLRDRFRVVAYARRGHGDSDAPDGPYDLATLTDDLRGVLDHLGIHRASLLGWSMGGHEITAFAARHPERVDRLVYLESGYDWADDGFERTLVPMLLGSVPATGDLASLPRYRAWFRREWLGTAPPWTDGLEAYLRNTVRIERDGSLKVPMSEAVGEALLTTIVTSPRDYSGVRAPALAIYGDRFFPTRAGRDARSRAVERWEREVMTPFRDTSVARIRRELAGVEVLRLADRTHMAIGIEEPAALAGRIASYLLRPPTAPSSSSSPSSTRGAPPASAGSR
jgi:pimeloyl-ACP methyl ester carboxylesterase